VYSTKIKSFTKGLEYDICVSSSYISENDRLLIIDDFLARGNSITGLLEIIEKSKASLEGIGIVIEKGFQEGGKKLRDMGIRVESLVVVKSMKDGIITFVK
jgi:xanthine phosphoribosyltransferase